MAFTYVWDAAFEAAPTDDNYGYEVDDYIRKLSIAIRERMEIDHIWKVGVLDGQHKRITLQQITKPTNVADTCFVYAKDASSKIELFFEDEDANEIQLTSAGKINLSSTGFAQMYAADSVGTDSYAVTLPSAPAALVTGMMVNFKAGIFNTGACTLAVNGLTATPIKKRGGLALALATGDIHTGQIVIVVYDGTNFQLINDPGESVGSIMPFQGETAPAGYLECNGASLLRASYPELFAVIGTIYGTADGTHFNVPDFRGYFLRGWDHAAAVDPDAATRTASDTAGATMTAGDHIGTEQNHAVEAHDHSGGFGAPASKYVGSGASYGNVNTGSYGTSVETRPINVNTMYCIKI
jgi:hypothetical protein